MTLDDVKAGDEVFLHRDRWSPAEKIKVERTTPTRIILPMGSAFTRGGKEIGTGRRWSSMRIEPVTPETQKWVDAHIAELKLKERFKAAYAGINRLHLCEANIDAVEAFLKTMEK